MSKPIAPSATPVDPYDAPPARIGAFSFDYHLNLPSTNTLALQTLRAGAIQTPHLIVAGHQTAGRGRRGRTCLVDPSGAVTATFIFPQLHAYPAASLVVGVLVRRTLQKHVGRPLLKWPNDVFLGSRRLAGVLVEGVLGGICVGVGINVTRPPAGDVADSAAALSDLGNPPSRGRVLIDLAAEMEQLPHLTWPDVADEFHQHHLLVGHRVTIDGVADRVVGVNDEGHLIGETRVYTTGSVRLLHDDAS